MRVLFIEKQIDYEPQGIMQLSAVLKEAGHETHLAIGAQENPADVAKLIEPDVVAYSVMTGSHQWYFDMNRKVKAALGDKQPFSIFGGPHPTFFPEMISEPGIDGICVGEGEKAIVELTDSLANGGLKPDLPNWWLKLEDEIIRNPVGPLIKDLGELPRPDRDLVYDKHEYSRITPIKHFMGSRGCPYNCTYCFNHAYYQIYSRERRGNQRPVDAIIDEANWVRSRWPLQQVVFIDDLFIIYDDWLEEFADKWPKQVGLPFFCNVRANLIVKGSRKADLLKKAGCGTVSMGIETANDRIRLQLLKRRMTQEDMVQAGNIIRDADIHITSTNILGLPSSTLEDDLNTMRLNAAARISYAHAFLFQPYPGTELGQFAQEENYMVGSFDDISEIAWERSIMVYEDEDEKRQVEHLQRLFAFGVEWPWLEPAILRLIKAPHNWLIDSVYWWAHKLFKGWMIKRRIHPVKMSVQELFTAARQLMSIRS
ncbi:MAG: radical SAM protein [Chloroflexota bacterium]|nr:radical SAM protein [Chloroflexota bacterium]